MTAGEERTFPVHTIATAPGGALQLLRPSDKFEVDDGHTSIQRALRNGDLVRVANPRPRPLDERFSPAMVTLTVGGPPAAFGNLPPLDPSTPARTRPSPGRRAER